MADGRIVAIRSTTGGVTTMRYVVSDHLNSVAVILDEKAVVIAGGRQSFDAWGLQRNADGTPDSTPCNLTQSSASTRGFTGQEEMAQVCLVNFNARLYDPQLGRFLSADPTTEAPDDLQDWNRYSYVLNNPLAFTDPSGMCFLGCFWQQSWFRDIVAIAVVFALQQWEVLPTLEGAAFAESTVDTILNGGILGGIGGAIATGTVKGAALGVLQGTLFAEAGNILQDNPSGFIGIGKTPGEFIAHGFVGGIVSLAGGGKFGSGFLAGGISSLGPSPNGMDEPEQAALGAVEHAILGGLGSVLGGGKFANGAVTGAFGYLFNDLAHSWANQGAVGGAVVGGVVVSGGCDVATEGVCALGTAGTFAAGSAAGAPIGYAMGYGAGAVADQIETVVVHGNSSQSMSGTEVYYLLNAAGEIKKIGITSQGEKRYPQSWLVSQGLIYAPQTWYQWRYPAMVDENIRLTWYQIEHGGDLPDLNKVTR